MNGFANNMFQKAQLPFKALSDAEVLLAERTIRSAWEYLKQNQKDASVNLVDAPETTINVTLVEVINALSNENLEPFKTFKTHFNPIRSSAEYRDYRDFEIPRHNQPDIVFHPRAVTCVGVDHTYQAYFVEAKLLNNRNNPLGLYFSEGVDRFVEGKYAWAMPIGLMLGYCQSSFDISQKLKKYLGNSINADKFCLSDGPVEEECEPETIPIYATTHKRSWSYHDRDGEPGDIKVRHLWLDCQPS